MVHGIGPAALALTLLLAGCRDAPRAADRPAADQRVAERQPAIAADASSSADSAAAGASPPSAATPAAVASVGGGAAVLPIGKYVVELPAADASMRRISIDLRPDSTCVFKTEFPGKGQRVESGFWKLDGALVRIVIGPPRDPSKQTRFTFAASPDSLVSAQWDTTRFGSEGLGTLVRAR